MSSVVAKSYEEGADPIIAYCTKLSVKPSPLEEKLARETLTRHEHSRMLGAPEVFQLGKNFIRLIGARRVLDVGTFTGASALAWALALPEEGEVLSCDVSHDALDRIGRAVIEGEPAVARKIKFHLGAALDKLDALIAAGESGKWDFAFVDADKPNYTNYYDRCMRLLRPGGVIMVDNSLWDGRVVGDASKFDESTTSIDACNRRIFADENSDSILLNVGDGTHLAFKK